MTAVPRRARPFVFLVCVSGAICLIGGMLPWRASHEALLFVSYLALTAIGSAFSAVMPEGTVSVSFVFFLLGICSLSLPETLSLALIATIFHHLSRRIPLDVVRFFFNLSQLALAITASYWTYHLLLDRLLHGHAPVVMLATTMVYFLCNTVTVATVVALVTGVAARKKWIEGYAWTFPYYLAGAAIAGIVQLVNRATGWEISILILPAVYAIYRGFRMQLGRWEAERRHLQDMAAVNMRTIETLALAIEAKDQTTGDHLQRVRVYCLALAKDLGLTANEIEALKAASVLHDIGKLAVPEHIISKPGKLTPEEFEKMKIHPIVGAEILEQVRFPFPVAPIVRSHHEKWDGSGYPDGLSGEQIPIGARILSAVDCLDALASDRQYRRALPLDEAIAKVEHDSGKAFDPRVVAALKARYIELEQLAKAEEPEERPKLSTDVKVQRGAAPDAGFGVSAAGVRNAIVHESDSASVSGNGRASFNRLPGLAEEVLSPDEMFSAAAVELAKQVQYDAMVIFAGDGVLRPCFVLGYHAREFSALRVRRGAGLAGWVAETGNPIINGNPAVEPGFSATKRPVQLRSALAVPIESRGSVAGVLALYRREADAFTSQDLTVLQTAAPELSTALAHGSEPGASPGFEAALQPEFVLSERALVTRSTIRK